ncbi:putative YigZ family protein [Rhizobium sp. PP-F2F-G48]|uniref:IMPACT family protein n=1 Tax=Rhizobium sp. PP-F2F-G48 TaxID=2135651 RepID=UPI0010448CBE|nr:YigZ family protein [Rhizobium sp. PP-F2F-G48]TCM56240.1 putative YigZ family protein [Rhizobium sp. PP-F2F-G48]
MLTLARSHSLSQEIRKSRFLAHAAPVTDEAEARAFIAAQSDLSASHNCWAWRIGQTYRFNDDGEPGGTAGKPILQAIDGQGLDHVVVLVIRWFGGILLGSGGLMRAYGGTAAMTLVAAERVEHIAMTRGTVRVAFSELARIKARLTSLGAIIVEEAFIATGADLMVDVPEGLRDQAKLLARDVTSGHSVLIFDDDLSL